MMKKLLQITLLLFFLSMMGQNYQPIDTADYVKRVAFLKKNNTMSEIYENSLKSKFSGSKGKEIVKGYREFHESFVKEVKNKDYTFDTKFNQFLIRVIDRLKINNPSIPNHLTILVAKNNIPNAMCIGDGTFIINMGLFNWLDNEDEIAAVLGHEISHKLKEHSLKWQEKLAKINEGNKTEIQNIKEQKINAQGEALSLFKSSLYKGSVERRKNEIEADSLGYVLFSKTDYNKGEYLKALQNLEKYDTIAPNIVEKETYKKLYDLPGAPFKDKWMKMEDFSQYKYDFYKEKINKDSVASHPEIANRINLLKKYFPELNKVTEPTKTISDEFQQLKKTARMEILPNFYQSEDYGLAIYSAMQFIQEGEEETYYKNWLGKCFAKIMEARKNYNLNRYLDRVEPKTQSESYQQFLNFMWNLSLDDLQKITNHYQTKNS